MPVSANSASFNTAIYNNGKGEISYTLFQFLFKINVVQLWYIINKYKATINKKKKQNLF